MERPPQDPESEESAAPPEAHPGAAHRAESPPSRRPFAFGFLAVAALILLLLLVIFQPLLRPLLWAAALATLVYPAHKRLLGLVRGRATLAATLTTILWIGVLVVPSFLAVGQLLDEVRDLWPRLRGHVADSFFEQLAARVHQSPLRRLVHLVFEISEDASAAVLEERFKSGVEALGNFFLHRVRDLTLGAPGILVQFFVTVVSFFFFLQHGPGWARRFREALPLPAAQADALLETFTVTVNAVFRGVVLTAAAQAVLATLGYIVAGVPVPFLLGFLTLIGALIPFVGAAGVWVPTCVGLYFSSGRAGAAIGLAIWGTLVVSLVDNFLRPYVIGRGARLPILWLFLAILGGLQSFGFLGLLLGPAALALFLACFRIYMQERRQARTAA